MSTQPPIQWVPGTLPGETKRSQRDTDHSLPSTAQVTAQSYASNPDTPSSHLKRQANKLHVQIV